MRKSLVMLRKSKGITQAEVAESIGISRSFYALIESGFRCPTYRIAKQLAIIFDHEVEELFFDIDDFKMKQIDYELLKSKSIREVKNCSLTLNHAKKEKQQLEVLPVEIEKR
ncbi:helix-turn-helix transcriptional regulator [Pelosinus sp. UFO1]|uniref:helix-turn-helix transcriptional regulator n=1 Tax=Pelosinus sp. UFO1 TaxID=484770 RepID=UPI0004D1677F|nr:helix-turn-helix transcriptional regulator [Pelosinus sp. UFO1]AIF54163.1 transcriptional regulator, XRE family [Pelosinus sp. UFO1]